MKRHVISARANIGAADVKPPSGGRSQNVVPPEAAHALEQAAKAKKTLAQ